MTNFRSSNFGFNIQIKSKISIIKDDKKTWSYLKFAWCVWLLIYIMIPIPMIFNHMPWCFVDCWYIWRLFFLWSYVQCHNVLYDSQYQIIWYKGNGITNMYPKLLTNKYIIHLCNIYLAFVKLHTEFLIFWIKRYEKKTTKIDNYQFQSFFQIGLKNQQNVQRVSLSKEKVVNLVKDVFISAAERDIYTGDAVVVHVITKDGTTTERFPLRRDWKLLLYDVKDSTFSAMWMYCIC